MSEHPERIWLLWPQAYVSGRYHASSTDHTEEGGYPEYTRTDLAEAALSAARAEGRREGLLEAAGIALAETKVPPQYNAKDKWRADIGADIWTAIRAAAEVSP